MATLESRNGWYRVVIRLDGEKYSRSLKTKDNISAQRCLAKIEDNLHRLELGSLELPARCRDPFDFLLGEKKQPPKLSDVPIEASTVTIQKAWDRFKSLIPEGSLEAETLKGMEIHVRHLRRLMGLKTKLSQIDKPVLQQYVDDRAKEPGQNDRLLSPETIKKELRTLSTIWGWMIEEKLVQHAFPNHRLRYPKRTEKPPFQTWEQIEAKLKRGGGSEYDENELWDSLFLSVEEVVEAVKFVKENCGDPMIHAMICVAAYTGARRSEILRSEVRDIDFSNGMLTVREKKRVRGISSTRTVPLQPELNHILFEWVSSLPTRTGPTFGCASENGAWEPVSRDQAHHFFKLAFANGKWAKLKGWHTFRHSFCSNCAAAGIEQRLINDWVGHQTNEMVRRYRHLFPNKQHEAIQRLGAKKA